MSLDPYLVPIPTLHAASFGNEKCHHCAEILELDGSGFHTGIHDTGIRLLCFIHFKTVIMEFLYKILSIVLNLIYINIL